MSALPPITDAALAESLRMEGQAAMAAATSGRGGLWAEGMGILGRKLMAAAERLDSYSGATIVRGVMSEEDYLLVCLGEEAAEIAHAVAKCLRFGLNHPWPGRGMSNRDCLRDEVRDLVRLAERLKLSIEGLPDKGEKFANAMALSRALGRLGGFDAAQSDG